jgi:hypothetical protein
LATTEDIQADRTYINLRSHLGIEPQKKKERQLRDLRTKSKDERKELARNERRCIQAARVLKGEFPYRAHVHLDKIGQRFQCPLEQARQFEQYAFKHWEEKLCRFDNLERCYGALLLPSTDQPELFSKATAMREDIVHLCGQQHTRSAPNTIRPMTDAEFVQFIRCRIPDAAKELERFQRTWMTTHRSRLTDR